VRCSAIGNPVLVAVRLSVGALLLTVVTLVAATNLLPARVRLGSRSITCDAVVFAQRGHPIASALCRRAGAYRLRANIGIAALLVVLSLWPILVERTRPSARVLAIWALSFVSVMGTMVALLAVVGARYTAVFFGL
jgi:hypothetical protein